MKKSKTNIVYPIHKMGTRCGYEEYEDGSIEIADSHAHLIEEAITATDAIAGILKAVTAQCQALMISVEEKKIQFWKGLVEDYGLNFKEFEYKYDPTNKILRKTPILKKE